MQENFYYEKKKKNSACKICGASPVETKELWYKTGWSRGDDDYIGKLCKNCQHDFNIGVIDFNWNEPNKKWITNSKTNPYENKI